MGAAAVEKRENGGFYGGLPGISRGRREGEQGAQGGFIGGRGWRGEPLRPRVVHGPEEALAWVSYAQRRHGKGVGEAQRGLQRGGDSRSQGADEGGRR